MGLGKLDWQRWLYGLAAGFVGGGASAVVGGITVSAIDSDHFNFMHMKFYALIGAMFLANGLTHAFAYLKQSPLPPEEPEA